MDIGARVIFFNVPEARDELVTKGLVYTLRSSFRSVGETDAVVGNMSNNTKLGRVTVSRVRRIIHSDDLLPYLHHSGFLDVDTWLSKASPTARTLYRVEMLK